MTTRKTNDENLGPAPKRVRIERSGSPVPSYQSVMSDASMDPPRNFKGENTVDPRVRIERSGSPVPSYQSVMSDASMDPPRNFKGENTVDPRVRIKRSGSPVPSYQSVMSDASMDPPRNFKGENTVDPRVRIKRSGSPVPSYRSVMSDASMDPPRNFKGENTVDPSQFESGCEEELSSGTVPILKLSIRSQRNLTNNADSQRRDAFQKRAQQALKTHLKEKFECVFETKQGYRTLLNEIYTELYITEGESVGVNNEHEVRLIETASRRQTTQETAILCNDIFKPLPGKKEPRTVLTKGIAGIGKTVSVQKFILDWAEGTANQDIDFIFTLPFRDLNLKKDKEFSLMQLLQLYFPELEEIKAIEDGVKVLFIFDGLDECRLPLDFQSIEVCCDITEVTSVDVLLTNLIWGKLLPSALLWITSRPAAASQIPPECVDLVTEIQGFSDPQKEEYFRKRFDDPEKASRIISHIKSVRSLYIMCHIPVFCWISATVLETMLGRAESGDLPKTLTEMYTHFLLIQTDLKNQKYHGTNETNPKKILELDVEIILKLGQLAFQQLEKGNLIFYEEDLKESGIDVREASVYSGVCTEIFKEECGLHQEKVFCFVHLSIQEYLAALFALHSWVNRNINVLAAEEITVGENVNHHNNSQVETADEQEESYYFDEVEEAHSDEEEDSNIDDDDDDVEEETGSDEEELERDVNDHVRLSKVHKAAVDQALESPNGHMDLFLRFLLGLSLDSTQTLLGKLLTQSGRGSFPPDGQEEINLKTAKYIKRKIRRESSAERTINLFHCLHELGTDSLVKEIQCSLRSGTLSDQELAPSQCSALAFVLLMSEEVLDEFDLKTYNTSAAGHDRLVPVIRNCRKAILKGCELNIESCKIVASVLESSNSLLRDVDISHMEDAGMKLLCAGLNSRNCELQRLGLNSCYLTKDSYNILASTLQSTNSPLRDLDLSFNDLGDSGLELLCAGLMSPYCRLQRLGLGWCDLTEGSCDILASVLCFPYSELRDLELRDNNLQDSGVRALSAGLEDPHCKLQRLGLSGCRVTQRGCDSLASALSSNPSHLRELDLRYNHPGDSGERALSAVKPDTLTLLVDNGGENRTKPGPRKYGCELTLDPNTAHRELSLSDGNRKVTHTPGREEPYPDHPERFEQHSQVLCRECACERCYWEAEFSLCPQGEISVAVTGKQMGQKGFSCKFDESKHSWCLQCDALTDPDELCFSVSHFKTHAQIPALPSPYRRARVRGDDRDGNDDYYDPDDDDNHDDSDDDDDSHDDSDDEDDDDDSHDDSDDEDDSHDDSDDEDDDDDSHDDSDDEDENDDNLDDGDNHDYRDDQDDNDDNHDDGDDANVYRVGVYVDRPANTLSFYSISNSDTLTLLHRFHTHFTPHTPLCAGFRVYDSWASLCQME